MTSPPDWTIVSQPAGTAARFPQAAGVYDIETRLASQAAGRFTLSLPPVQTAMPLVLVLHYAGQPTRFYGRPLLTGLIEPALRSLNAMFVAPESLGGQWHEEANEAFVIGLIKQLMAHYPIATDRVVVTGYSMGAIGTWHFITHYPELFSAAIPIAGFPNRELRSVVPVHAFHSVRDELFSLDHLRAAVSEAQAAGVRLELTETMVNGHFDVNGYALALAVVPAWLEQIWAE